MVEMTGRICLITGANRGIGKATALALARKGATVVMAARDPILGAVARAEVIETTGNGQVDLLVADLASLADVRQLAADFQERYSELHVLINNAGLTKHDKVLTEDGFETTFAVNHLAPFLLTNLLLDMMKASAPARIINVNSMMHKWGRINFDNLQGERYYNMHMAYSSSKLANMLFTCELGRRLDGSAVTVNAAHPGMVATDFAREYTGFIGFMANKGWRPFMKSPEAGATTPVYLAASPEVANITGKYFVSGGVRRSSRLSCNRELAEKMWSISVQLTHHDQEE
jgi:NAD(P)-dependent dehydrogenase (short-subunit alcohol dehydrogenase family)